MTYNTIPSAQQSTWVPKYSFLRTSSGAIYEGVPQKLVKGF